MLPDISSIKARRHHLGVKQKELALYSKVSQSLIAKLESGKLEPSYSVVKRIFSVLDSLEHQKEKTCGDIMSINLLTLKKTDSVEKASELMKERSISQIPILENKRVIGSINESIILDELIKGADKKSLFSQPVSSIMREPFPLINKSTPVSIALPLLKTSEAILISDKDALVGIITKSNLL